MNILIVSAQFPYPPRTGFAMRVSQLARHLAAHHDVTVLAYGRPEQRDCAAALAPDVSLEIVERVPRSVLVKRLAQVRSAASATPYACLAEYSPALQAAVDEICERREIDLVQLESSYLCALHTPPGVRVVLDEHNIEYEVFKRMADGERTLARRAFNTLEHARLRRVEQSWWRRVDACVVTSDREAPTVARHAPGTPLAVVPNGVDLEAFRPGAAEAPDTLVFNGTLRYRPNLEAARHLVHDIWPRVRARRPDARLTIVGAIDTAMLEGLRAAGVELTGEVPDVRPFLGGASVVGVPVRIGGGTRLKILEALAMGKAVVSTSLGCEGVAVRNREHLRIADDADAFAAAVVELFDDRAARRRLGAAGRALMEAEYSWEAAAQRLDALISTLEQSPMVATG